MSLSHSSSRGSGTFSRSIRSSSSTTNAPKYAPSELVHTMEISQFFFPLFYAGERGALGIWDKQVGLGHIKRRVEDDGGKRYHVLELVNAHSNTGTFLVAPKGDHKAIHITLNHLVIILKNFRRSFSFEIQVIDNRGLNRRFSFATWFNPINLKRWSFLCQVPLKLELGWNEIHVDLDDLLKSTYRTSYVQTVRLQIHANCRLRQVFFCDETIVGGKMAIPSMKMFENMRLLSSEFGPLNHPNYLESGPLRRQERSIPEPPTSPPLTRVERDLQLLTLKRYNQLTKGKLVEPYKSYFKDFIGEKEKEEKSLDSFLASHKLESARNKDEEKEGQEVKEVLKNHEDYNNTTTTPHNENESDGLEIRSSSEGYNPPTSRPPSASAKRSEFYFRAATPFPPNNN